MANARPVMHTEAKAGEMQRRRRRQERRRTSIARGNKRNSGSGKKSAVSRLVIRFAPAGQLKVLAFPPTLTIPHLLLSRPYTP